MAFTRVRGPGITTEDNYRVGIITAAKFVGPIETTVDSDFTNINVTGIGTIDGVKIGNPSGIITASSSSGIVTYYGDASKLTGLTAGQIPNLAASKITTGTVATARLGSGTANNTTFLRGDQTWASNTSTTINNNANNKVITGSGTADTLEAEANLTFDGTTLSATGAVSLAGPIVLQPGGTAWSTTNNRPQIQRQADGELRLGAGSDSSSIVTFYTSPSAGGTLTEKLRITSAGNVGINSIIPSQKLDVMDGTVVVHPASKTGIALNGITGQDVGVVRWGGDNHHAIILRGSSNADGSTITGGNSMEFREYGAYSFKTGNNSGTMTERLSIETTGRIYAKTNQSTTGLIVQNTVHDSQLRIEASAANKNSIIQFADGADGDVGMIDYDHNGNTLTFTVNGSERLNISDSGMMIGTGTPSEDLHLKKSRANFLVEGTNDTVGGNVANINVRAPYYRKAGYSISDTGGNEDFWIGRPYGEGDANAAVAINMGGVEKLRITSTGDVHMGNSGVPSFASISGNNEGGLEIHNVGNDTAACLKLTGNNNSGGSPGQETFTQLEHRGGNLTFNINHAGTERFKIDAQGNVHVSDGNLVVANDHGIDFSASESSDATSGQSVLDDYEQGTFTAYLYGHSTGSGSNRCTGFGYYTKVGNVVTCSFTFSNQNGNNLNDSEQVRIAGMPFVAANIGNQTSSMLFSYNIGFGVDEKVCFISASNASYLRGYRSRNTATWQPWSTTEFTVSQIYLSFNMTYLSTL